MSQYAFYLQKKRSESPTFFLNFSKDHNGFELDKVFGIQLKKSVKEFFLNIIFRLLLTDKLIVIPLKKILFFCGCSIVQENFDYNFNPDILKSSRGITFYYGGWHHPDYFKDSKEAVLTYFNFNAEIDHTNKLLKMSIEKTNSVSIHIRRGDFLDENNINIFGDICNLFYYNEAINYINKKIINPTFFIFSNDLDWVKENLQITNVIYVDCNSGNNSWKDMYLMSLCKNNIIANSTFSWWGAWLNQNTSKLVISPDRFIRSEKPSNIYPNNWYKIPTK